VFCSPSVPDQNREEIIMDDLIRREDAIKALRCEYPMMPMFKSLREEWAIKTEGFRKAEEVINAVLTLKTKSVKYYDEGERVWKIGEVIVDE
jgi:hypothetical protein